MSSEGTNQAKVPAMLRRDQGASGPQIAEAVGAGRRNRLNQDLMALGLCRRRPAHRDRTAGILGITAEWMT